MSPSCATPNGNFMYLYLPNGQENVVKYDNYSFNFRLGLPKPASMSVRYLTPASFSRIVFNVGTLCIGLISTLLSMARSRQNHTLPLAFGTMTKLFHIPMSNPNPAVLLFAASIVASAPP